MVEEKTDHSSFVALLCPALGPGTWDIDHTIQTPLPPCFWLGVVIGGTSMRSEGRRREARVFTHWLPSLASSLYLQPLLLPGGPSSFVPVYWLFSKGQPAPDQPLMLVLPNVAHTFVNSLNCLARRHAICFLPGLTHTGCQFVECKALESPSTTFAFHIREH